MCKKGGGGELCRRLGITLSLIACVANINSLISTMVFLIFKSFLITFQEKAMTNGSTSFPLVS